MNSSSNNNNFYVTSPLSPLAASIYRKHINILDITCFSHSKTDSMNKGWFHEETGLDNLIDCERPCTFEQYKAAWEKEYDAITEYHSRICGQKSHTGQRLGCSGNCQHTIFKDDDKFTDEELKTILLVSDYLVSEAEDCHYNEFSLTRVIESAKKWNNEEPTQASTSEKITIPIRKEFVRMAFSIIHKHFNFLDIMGFEHGNLSMRDGLLGTEIGLGNLYFFKEEPNLSMPEILKKSWEEAYARIVANSPKKSEHTTLRDDDKFTNDEITIIDRILEFPSSFKDRLNLPYTDVNLAVVIRSCFSIEKQTSGWGNQFPAMLTADQEERASLWKLRMEMRGMKETGKRYAEVFKNAGHVMSTEEFIAPRSDNPSPQELRLMSEYSKAFNEMTLAFMEKNFHRFNINTVAKALAMLEQIDIEPSDLKALEDAMDKP